MGTEAQEIFLESFDSIFEELNAWIDDNTPKDWMDQLEREMTGKGLF